MNDLKRFRYRAACQDGRMVRGEIRAPNAPSAGAVLVERGMFPISLRDASNEKVRRRAARRRDLAVVFRSVASLVAAGVPVERALAVSEPLARGTLAAALAVARQRLREGATLTAALEASPGVIPRNVLGIVAAGERGSQLGRSLIEASSQLEQEAELSADIRSALAYPMVILTVGAGSIFLMGAVVVPRFALLLADLGQTLPASTRALLSVSLVVEQYWWAIALATAGTIVGLAAWRQAPAGRLRSDAALLRLPLIGRIRHGVATARTCRALGGMLDAGMPLLPALAAATRAAGDAAVSRRLAAVRERVARGERISSSLRRESALVPSALQLMNVGESSGDLAVMARRAGDIAARDAQLALKTLVNLLEPALVIALGGVVALVAAAVLQAVYSLRPGVG